MYASAPASAARSMLRSSAASLTVSPNAYQLLKWTSGGVLAAARGTT